MQDLDRNIERDRKLNQRWWQGVLLAFAVVLVFRFIGNTLIPPVRDPLAPRTFWDITRGVLFVVLGLGVAASIFYLIFWMMEPLTQNLLRGAEVLPRTMPELAPKPAEKPAHPFLSGKSLFRYFALFLVFFIVFWGISSSIRHFWPDAPMMWVRPISNFVIIIGGNFTIMRIAARRREKAGGEKAPSLKADLLRMASWAFFLAFIFLPTFSVLYLVERIDLSFVPAIFLMVFLTFSFFLTIYQLLPNQWIWGAFNRADYETAAGRAQWVERWYIFAGEFMNLRGYVLFLAGRYDEAIQALKGSIRATRSELSPGGAPGLDNLGCVLTAQGQYDEAIKLFEGSITISPQQTAAYNDWAQVYLFQGVEPERALGLADRALKNYRASWSGRFLERYQCSVAHSSRAWALAQLGRHAEAAQALEQAFAAADRRFTPEFAGVLYRAGQAELLGGDRDKAIEHWRQARQLDPHGRFGGLAAALIK